MGNECFLSFTTSHLSLSTQKLPDGFNIAEGMVDEHIFAKYRLRIVHPPKLPLEKKPNPDKDGPDIEPNLWMWVNPNIVYPPGKLEVARLKKEDLPGSQPALKEEDAPGGWSGLPSSSQPPPPQKRKRKQKEKHVVSSPRVWEEHTEEEQAKDQDDSSSVALPSLPTRAPPPEEASPASHQPRREALVPTPPQLLPSNCLGTQKQPPGGLNVQQIYNFTREHFPFFRTAPEGWKNTVRHNLCFRDSFEKVPVSMQGEASLPPPPPRSCLWKLTEEGHRRFAEEARTLASTRLESIQQCMSQPDVMPLLFHLQEEADMF